MSILYETSYESESGLIQTGSNIETSQLFVADRDCSHDSTIEKKEKRIKLKKFINSPALSL